MDYKLQIPTLQHLAPLGALQQKDTCTTFKPTVWRNKINCCTFQAWIVLWVCVYHVCV